MLAQNDHLNISFIPFLSYGHMIPMIDVARLFAKLGAHVTIITTSANAARFQTKIDRDLIAGRRIRFHVLQWPAAEVGLSPGVENFSTASLLDRGKVYKAYSMLETQIEQVLIETRPDCLVSDMFYHWTTKVASKLGIPRLSFHGSSFFALCAEQSIKIHEPHNQVDSKNEKFSLPDMPDFIQMTISQIPNWSITPDWFSELLEIVRESEKQSFGLLMNSFYELENRYEEHLNKITGMRTWSIGPVSLSVNKDGMDMTYRGENPSIETSDLFEWLNEKDRNSVLYISFGSMVKFKPNQISEIAHALESSNHNFIWVIQKNANEEDDIDDGLPKGFEEKTKESKKGLIIRGWAPQLLILDHVSVGGLVTHCGWNSILEGISVGLPMITWPLFAEQFYNERLLIDVLKIGVEVGSKKWYNLGEEGSEAVKREDIEKAVVLLMGESDIAIDMRKKAKELGEAAKRAVSSGGLSEINLVSLFKELQTTKLNRQRDGLV